MQNTQPKLPENWNALLERTLYLLDRACTLQNQREIAEEKRRHDGRAGMYAFGAYGRVFNALPKVPTTNATDILGGMWIQA